MIKLNKCIICNSYSFLFQTEKTARPKSVGSSSGRSTSSSEDQQAFIRSAKGFLMVALVVADNGDGSDGSDSGGGGDGSLP